MDKPPFKEFLMTVSLIFWAQSSEFNWSEPLVKFDYYLAPGLEITAREYNMITESDERDAQNADKPRFREVIRSQLHK